MTECACIDSCEAVKPPVRRLPCPPLSISPGARCVLLSVSAPSVSGSDMVQQNLLPSVSSFWLALAFEGGRG